MEIRHLRYFLAVASELHFGKAAERLNVAGPTLSAQIKWLESYLGVQLFVRSTNRKVELTFAGQQFQGQATTLIDKLEQARQVAQHASRGEIGGVRLAYILAAATEGYVGRAVEASRAATPNVVVHVQRLETIPQIKAINAGSLDVGFTRRMDSYSTGIAAINVGRQRFCVALHRDHPLARQKQISPAILAKQRFVAFSLDAEIGFWRNIAEVLPPNAVPNIVQRTGDALSVMMLISANIGIGVVPVSFKNIAGPKVVLRNISGPPRYAENVLVYRANETSPAVLSFLKTMRSTFP
jgi:DNA-binding transcriptional LysR family regulator